MCSIYYHETNSSFLFWLLTITDGFSQQLQCCLQCKFVQLKLLQFKECLKKALFFFSKISDNKMKSIKAPLLGQQYHQNLNHRKQVLWKPSLYYYCICVVLYYFTLICYSPKGFALSNQRMSYKSSAPDSVDCIYRRC